MDPVLKGAPDFDVEKELHNTEQIIKLQKKRNGHNKRCKNSSETLSEQKVSKTHPDSLLSSGTSPIVALLVAVDVALPV